MKCLVVYLCLHQETTSILVNQTFLFPVRNSHGGTNEKAVRALHPPCQSLKSLLKPKGRKKRRVVRQVFA